MIKPDKLNVCLINDSFPPIIDGVARVVQSYAELIEKNFGTAIVATPEYEGAIDDYAYKVLRYPSFDTTKFGDYRAGYPFSVSAINNLAEYPIDIIHAHCPATATTLARTLRKTVDAPLILTYHTKYDIDIKNAIKSKLLQKAAINILIGNVEACDEVWVVSRGAGENLKSLGYEGDYIVMNNGVDMEKRRSSEAAICKLKQQYNITAKTVFLFVGRMKWYKGIRYILDAMPKLRQGTDFCCVFVGDGDDKDEIIEYSKTQNVYDKCVFAGAIKDREILRTFYCMANALMLPSTFDTNGLVVREAAACETPCILISGSCAAEGVIHNTNGLLIEENSDSMYAALDFVCNNHEAMRTIGKNASNELYLSWNDGVAKAVERYHVVAENYKRGICVDKIDTTGDVFFQCMAWLCDGIQAADGLRDKINHKLFEERMKRLDDK